MDVALNDMSRQPPDEEAGIAQAMEKELLNNNYDI
jgi:hypothetical protein